MRVRISAIIVRGAILFLVVLLLPLVWQFYMSFVTMLRESIVARCGLFVLSLTVPVIILFRKELEEIVDEILDDF